MQTNGSQNTVSSWISSSLEGRTAQVTYNGRLWSPWDATWEIAFARFSASVHPLNCWELSQVVADLGLQSHHYGDVNLTRPAKHAIVAVDVSTTFSRLCWNCLFDMQTSRWYVGSFDKLLYFAPTRQPPILGCGTLLTHIMTRTADSLQINHLHFDS